MTTTDTIEKETVAVQTDRIVHLPLGLLGFENIKQYALIAEPGQEPFLWLQMMAPPHLAFLVISPFDLSLDYQPELSQEDVRFVGLEQPEDALIYNIVTLRANGVSTMNLKGPIVLNRHTLRGKQAIPLNGVQFSLQHPLPTAE